MKSKPRFKFPDEDSQPDVCIKADGEIQISGEALDALKRQAKEARMSLKKFFNKKILDSIHKIDRILVENPGCTDEEMKAILINKTIWGEE
jgi:hypothetical protein